MAEHFENVDSTIYTSLPPYFYFTTNCIISVISYFMYIHIFGLDLKGFLKTRFTLFQEVSDTFPGGINKSSCV